MRAYLPVLVSVLLGAVVGGVLFLLPVARQAARPSGAPPQAAPQTPRPALTPTPPPAAAPTLGAASPAAPPANPTPPPLALSSPVLDGAGGDLAADALAAARALAAAGRLREAQDEYVQVLLVAPDNDAALRELVAVRRRLAGEDAALLRRQAAAYRRAIARGEETEEHYTVPAMRILAQASIVAAQEIEQGVPQPPRGAAASPIILPATPVARPVATPLPPPPAVGSTPTANPVSLATPAPTPRPVRVTPRPRPTRRATVRPTPKPRSTPVPPLRVTPAPVIPTPAPPTPQPSLDVNELFFIIQIGPLFDANRASEIAADLTVSGYAARVSRAVGGTSYYITLGPYRRSAVEAIVNDIRRRFGAGLPVAVTPAR